MIKKPIYACISFIVITSLIAMMYLEKNDTATKILNREIENFDNQNKKKKIFDEDYEYLPYEKQEGFTPIIEGLNIGRSIRKAFMKPFKPLIDFFNKLKSAFESLPGRIASFSTAFQKVGEGIKLEFINLGKSLDMGFGDVFDVVGTIGNCGIKTLTNIRTCMIWYIIDLVFSTLYSIFVDLPVFIIYHITGFDVQPYVDTINCLIEELDAMCFEYTCYHFIHFPDWVIETCYTCKFQDKVDKLNKDFKRTIPGLLNEPANKFYEAKINFEKVFS